MQLQVAYFSGSGFYSSWRFYHKANIILYGLFEQGTVTRETFAAAADENPEPDGLCNEDEEEVEENV